MARARTIAERVEQLLDRAVVATTPVAGGDICTATRLRLSDGTSALAKTRPGAPAGFFETEARGLRWLAEPGVVDVAEVLAVETDCLVLGWVEPARATPEVAASLGRSLARLHASGAPAFGASEDGFVGYLPLPNAPAPTWPEFYAVRRVLPYLKLARDRGHVDARDAATVEALVGRLTAVAGPRSRPPGCTATCGRATSSGRPTGPSWSTRPRTAATARPTWLCSRCSAHPTSSACSTRTPRSTRSPTGGASASRSTRSSRCWCTRPCSAAATDAAPRRPPRGWCDHLPGWSRSRVTPDLRLT